MILDRNEPNEKLNDSPFGLKDVLAFIDMAIEEDPSISLPVSADGIFEELSFLINKTVKGTKIRRFGPKAGARRFHRFEIYTEEGEVLGSLNMIYLRKPITSYYLIYVEVLPHFRGQGLGTKILNTFKELADASKAIGLLDNIILPEDPAFNLYDKLGWRPIEEWIGLDLVDGNEHYMIYVPDSLKTKNLKEKLTKIFLKVKKKRSIIDMQENEAAVKRTIMEFQIVYKTLTQLFEKELANGISTPFMSFMFTKFVRKVLGFRRRIATLLGYTGGESLDQISISNQIKDLPILPYSLWSPLERQVEILEEIGTIRNLPEKLLKEPTFFIEDLPLYQRPYFSSWMEKEGKAQSLRIKISDMIELGFDPTRLREFRHEGKNYIFERISPGLLGSLIKIRNLLKKISSRLSGIRFHNTAAFINPPLAIFRDRGNAYILRQKVEGIHLDEALDQLRTSPRLKEMNQTLGIDRVLVSTVNGINQWLVKTISPRDLHEIENLTFFVSWDIEKNMPKVMVDVPGVSFDAVWIA